MALSAVRKVFCCGTKSNISSVTLVPFTDRRSLSPKPLSKLVSLRFSVAGTEGMSRLAKIRSMLMPENSSLIMGTKASGTCVISLIAPGGAIFSRMEGKCSKKSSRKTCLGTTTRVSMSEPAQVNLRYGINRSEVAGQSLTWPINTKAITAKCEDFSTRCINYRLRFIFRIIDVSDKFHGDLLDQLECCVSEAIRSISAQNMRNCK